MYYKMYNVGVHCICIPAKGVTILKKCNIQKRFFLKKIKM